MTVIFAKILLSLYILQWHYDKMIEFDHCGDGDVPKWALWSLQAWNFVVLALSAHCLWRVL